MDKQCLVKFEDATIVNGETPVLYKVNLELWSGDFLYIIGKVGSGKSSVIYSIIGENPIEQGDCEVLGYNLRGLKYKHIASLRRKIGVVFQDFKLLMDRSISDNLDFVLRSIEWKDKKEREERIEEVLKEVDLINKAHKMPHQLSGGEQQRIAIARALLNRPSLILADEPTGNLDSETTQGIMNLLRKINQEGTAIIMVTHNTNLCKQYPGRLLICENESTREITMEELS